MSLQEYYEDSFKSDQGRGTSDMMAEVVQSTKGLANYALECKTKFLSDIDWQDMKVLEMGSGRGGLGLHLARLGSDVTLVDFSPSALEQGGRLFALENFTPKIIKADVTHPDV